MWEAEIERITVSGWPRQNKFASPHLNSKKLGAVYIPIILAMVGSIK
jgi:hypothetical protein